MSGTDYSKNHTGLVLHLRTIHFSLILLSVVVYVFSLSTSNDKVQRALIEYRELHKFVQSVDWDANIIQQLCKQGAASVQAGSSSALMSEYTKTKNIRFWKKIENRIYEWNLKPLSLKKYYCEIDSPVVKQIVGLIDNKTKFDGPYGYGVKKINKPETIQQFSRLWNSLANGINIYQLIKAESKQALVVNSVDLNKPFENKMIATTGVNTVKPVKKPGDEFFRYRRAVLLTRNLKYEFDAYSHEQQQLSAGLFIYSAIEFEEDMVLFIPVYTKVQSYAALTAFMEKYSMDHSVIKPGGFDKSFPALGQLIKAAPSIKKLNQLELFLREAEINPDNLVSIFNIKMNVNDLLYFGSIMIAGLLLYFWLILRALAYKLDDDYHAYSAPWVGIFPDPLSFLLTAVSVVVVPVTVSILQIVRVFNVQSFYEQIVSGVLMLILGLVSIVVLVNYHKLFRKALAFARTLKTKSASKKSETGS